MTRKTDGPIDGDNLETVEQEEAPRPGPRDIPPSMDDDIDGTTDIPQCFSCVWYHGNGTCDAYPDEIPFEIYINQIDHRKPYRGDHGIQYKAR